MGGGDRKKKGPSTRSSRARQRSSSSSEPACSVNDLASDATSVKDSQEKTSMFGVFAEKCDASTAMELDPAALEVMRDYGGASSRSKGSDATSSSQQDLDARRTPDSSDTHPKRAQNKGEKKRQLGEAMLERDDSSGSSSKAAPRSSSRASSRSSRFSRSQTKVSNGSGEVRPDEERRRAKSSRDTRRRSVKIVTHIDELAKILDEAGAPAAQESNRASVLDGISDYIEQLRSRNSSLETEQCEIVSKIVSVAAAREDVDEKVDKVDYRLVFLQSSVPMAVASLDGKILACNERFVEGIEAESRAQLLSRTIFDLARPESLKHIFSCMSTLLCSEDDAPCGDVTNALKACESTMTLTYIKDASAKNRVFTISLFEQPLSASSSVAGSPNPNEINRLPGDDGDEDMEADLKKDLAVVENSQRIEQLAFIREQYLATCQAVSKRITEAGDQHASEDQQHPPSVLALNQSGNDSANGDTRQTRGDAAADGGGAAATGLEVRIVG